jgi:AraC-like DNA-binding protein
MPGLIVLVRPGTPYEFQFAPQPLPHMLNTHFDLIETPDSHHPFPYPPAQRRIAPPAIPADPAAEGYLPSVQQVREPLVYEQAFYRLHAVATLPGLVCELARKSLLLELLRLLHDNRRGAPYHVTPAHRDLLAKAVGFMQDRLDAPLTVADIVAHVHVSRALLARCFRNAYGTSPARHLVHLRIERAKTELTYGARPVKEIATGTGFGSVQHFTRVFHRVTGLPPATFRRRFGA